MNKVLLNLEFQQYINDNLTSDITSLILKKQNFKDVSNRELIEQIESKKRSRDKLPTWYNTENIYYPNKLNIEQTSSEQTAKYKSNLVEGSSLIDLTTGLGIDLYYFSKKFTKVIGCEVDPALVEITRHNLKVLEVENVELIITDSTDYLKNTQYTFDWIYIDPSRRNNNNKVFRFSDSKPNIVENLQLYLKTSKNILIKSSPLVDISLGIKELIYVKEIHIVSVKNEVKESLWLIKKDHIESPDITCINIDENGDTKFEFNYEDELKAEIDYSEPLIYLYEPYASIMKSGAFKSVALNTGVKKLHRHSHLYTSQNLVAFPGRRFKIIKILPFNKRLIKKNIPSKANVSTRNFPIAVKDIRRLFNISDGGEHYIFFTTINEEEKVAILCEKVQ